LGNANFETFGENCIKFVFIITMDTTQDNVMSNPSLECFQRSTYTMYM